MLPVYHIPIVGFQLTRDIYKVLPVPTWTTRRDRGRLFGWPSSWYTKTPE